MKPNIILFDVDNTLADMSHRVHYLSREDIDWDEFESQAVFDSPILPTIWTAQAYKHAGCQVWIWTGRSDKIEDITKAWLRNYKVPVDQLIMRPYGEEMPTSELKVRWLKEVVPQDRVICAYDDDPKVIERLKQQKLQVMQVHKVRETS